MKITFILSLVVLMSATASAAERPNFVFFILDDAFREDLNYSEEGKGKNLTPNIDRLSREGTIFSRQQIPSSVCTPSRFSALTGLYANRSPNVKNDKLVKQANMTVINWSPVLFEDTPNLPRKLQQAGYFTGMAGKCHFYYPPGRKKFSGKDPHDPVVKATLEHNYQASIEGMKRLGFDAVESFYIDGQVNDHRVPALRQHNMDWVAQGGINLIDQAAASDKPFYLYIATTMPHSPREPEVSWNADPRVTARGLLDEPLAVLPPRSSIPERIKEAGLEFNNNKGMMLAIDDALGALVAKLEAVGELDNTIIFFFNDNGQEGKGTVYEGGMTSPSFVWKKGGFPIGSQTDALVSNIDFAPTMLDWAEKSYYPDDFDGVSLVPLLKGEVEKVRDFSYGEMGFARAIRKGDWKYIAVRYPENAREIPSMYYKVERDPTHGIRPTFGQMAAVPNNPQNASNIFYMRELAEKRYPGYWDEDQLYNLANDPLEQVNVAGDPANQAILKEMQGYLREKSATIPRPFGEFKTE